MSARDANANSHQSQRNGSEVENELPEGWTASSFMELFDIQGGTQPPKSQFVYEPTKGYVRLLQIRDFGEKQLPTYVPFKPSLKTCNENDILIGRYGASIGRICTGMQGAYNVALAKVLIPREIETRFTFYLLRSEIFQRPILDIERSAQDGFNKDDLASIKMPLPPLAEQRRIVSKLEEVLGKVQQSQQRLARIPALLKRFRQSVLAAACSGKLTADCRKENIPALIDLPTEIDIPATFPTLPTSWTWNSLESICINVVDCPHSTPKWSDAGKLCIRTTNFRPGILDLSEVRFVSVETFNGRIERLRPESGDIVYSREGGILGIACQIPPNVELCLGQRMMLFRARSNYTATLLMHWLNSPTITEWVQELTGGSASPHLNVRDIRAFPTPVPPLSEQQEIVRRVEQLFAFADQIEARFKKVQAHFDRLTQSVLAKAFRGELVPTEAELARRENRTFEPASELLARIQADRDKGCASTKTTTKKRSVKRK